MKHQRTANDVLIDAVASDRTGLQTKAEREAQAARIGFVNETFEPLRLDALRLKCALDRWKGDAV